MNRVLEQQRAKYALDEIMEINKKPDKTFKKDYASLVRRIPTMILNNGLGQTLAFLLSKQNKDKDAECLYGQLQTWLCGTNTPEDKNRFPRRIYIGSTPDLIGQIMGNDRHKYIHAQVEAMSLLNWMKKFADAYLPQDDNK